MKILLMSSDIVYGEKIEDALKKKEYDIKQVFNIEDASAIISDQSVGIIIIDNRDHNTDVLDLCRHVRGSCKNNYIYIIMIVSGKEKITRIAELEAGADSFIEIPVDFDELEALIKVGDRISSTFVHSIKEIESVPLKTDGLQEDKDTPSNDQGKAEHVAQLPKKPKKRKGPELKGLSEQDRILSKIVLSNRLVANDQLLNGILIFQSKKTSGEEITLAEVLLDEKIITTDIMNDLMVATKRRVGKRFGIIAVEKGFASQEMIDKALQTQAQEFKEARSCRRIGDILVEQGTITEQERDLIWLEQKNFETKPIHK